MKSRMSSSIGCLPQAQSCVPHVRQSYPQQHELHKHLPGCMQETGSCSTCADALLRSPDCCNPLAKHMACTLRTIHVRCKECRQDDGRMCCRGGTPLLAAAMLPSALLRPSARAAAAAAAAVGLVALPASIAPPSPLREWRPGEPTAAFQVHVEHMDSSQGQMAHAVHGGLLFAFSMHSQRWIRRLHAMD